MPFPSKAKLRRRSKVIRPCWCAVPPIFSQLDLEHDAKTAFRLQVAHALAHRHSSARSSQATDGNEDEPPAAPVLVVGGSGSSGGDEHRGAQLPPLASRS